MIDNTLRECVLGAIKETADDLTVFLQSDVPLEDYAHDINFKMESLMDTVEDIFNAYD